MIVGGNCDSTVEVSPAQLYTCMSSYTRYEESPRSLLLILPMLPLLVGRLSLLIKGLI